ncbi:MAG: tetraacyldisaccharide 4'-kinase [Pseudomonadota bacterium]
MEQVTRHWQRLGLVNLLLSPLSALFAVIIWLRRRAYQYGLLRTWRSPVPVIIVGNITAGGSGKTPLVLWLARHLQTQGYRPGIVSRGYRARHNNWPQLICADDDPHQFGDEPVLLARQSGCPVCVGPDRPAAVRALLAAQPCDIILADDGLQHYALDRDIEIVVVGTQGLGNRWLLPAGPLREPASRLRQADLIIHNNPIKAGHQLHWGEPTITPLHNPDAPPQPLNRFRGQSIHAVAGIAYPEHFFALLRTHGLILQTHPFPDHHPYTPDDCRFSSSLPILMTHKDAVKCKHYALPDAWVVNREPQPDAAFITALHHLLETHAG